MGRALQQNETISLSSIKVFPILQPATVENVLYRRVYVSACRKQSAHVLRSVCEAHILQLLSKQISDDPSGPES
jgi:hypothetical protein